jgi:hypothetical protein
MINHQKLIFYGLYLVVIVKIRYVMGLNLRIYTAVLLLGTPEDGAILVGGTFVATADTRPYYLVPGLAAAFHQNHFFLEDYQYDKNVALKWRGSDRHWQRQVHSGK